MITYGQLKALVDAANRGQFAGRLLFLRDAGLTALWEKEFKEREKAK